MKERPHWARSSSLRRLQEDADAHQDTLEDSYAAITRAVSSYYRSPTPARHREIIARVRSSIRLQKGG